MNQQQRDALAYMEVSRCLDGTIRVSIHTYSCRCKTCLRWWVEMGPDGDPTDLDAYGPFTRDEIIAEARRMNLPRSHISLL